MAPPDILDWVDVKGFRYAKRKQANIRLDLAVNEFLTELGNVDIDLNTLTNTKVFAISAQTKDVSADWNAYRCICAELEYDGKIFVLHNGKWYEVAKSFTDEVMKAFNETADSKIELPDYAR